MKKILSVFKRNYEGNRQVFDEVVKGCEWVIAGEGVPTVKHDGTACMVCDGELYKRYDRKLSKAAAKRKRKDNTFIPQLEHYKPAPEGWKEAELEPNLHTGHWPGWVPVGAGPEDQYHREAFSAYEELADDTYELIGPKIQGNPHKINPHKLVRHGSVVIFPAAEPTFEGIREWLTTHAVEGIVWHHPDRRMAKIKRHDFGFSWPLIEHKSWFEK